MRPLKNSCEIAVIGGGLAGLSAARHAIRLGRRVTLFEASGIYGGQVATVGHIQGLPFPGQISGQELAMHILDEIRKRGVQIVETAVSDVQLNTRINLVDEQNNTYHPETIIVGSGASLRKLGVPGEQALLGRGVSQCATCDGGFFRGEHVVVVGGGDGAVQEALELVKTSEQVTLVTRSPLKAQREAIDKLAAKENIQFVWDSAVMAVQGDDRVTGVRLRNINNGSEQELPCAAVFPFIGVEPNSGFLPSFLLTDTGHIEVNHEFATSDSRIFAVGAVRTKFGGSLVQAMSEGISAASSAVRLIA